MHIGDVMDELGRALGLIPDLRVTPYWASKISPPMAIVAWPDELVYDTTMGRGADRFQMPVYVFAGNSDARSARDTLAPYISGSGPSSVKAVVEAHSASSYDSARVMSARVEVMTVAAVEFLTATFRIDVIGRGE